MMKSKPIHPFPARMAPEIVLEECKSLPVGSVVLDPMCGSGTTLRMAIESGVCAVGSDLDPLAVLISKVNTTPLDRKKAAEAAVRVVGVAESINPVDIILPWIDDDQETEDFIKFWFADKQINALRRLAYVIPKEYSGDTESFLNVALSRLIITKEMAASLARDTSHSRPHRVALINDFDVNSNFIKSAKILADRIPDFNVSKAVVSQEDARYLQGIKDMSIDTIITSPPYLNAIDYMRGNKLALVWLGHSLSDLRNVRSISIGAERMPDKDTDVKILDSIIAKMDFYTKLQHKEKNIFSRYIIDIYALMKEMNRVLKPGGRAIMVVGNSCLRGVFIRNTDAVKEAAMRLGLEKAEEKERDLPDNKRYLPLPQKNGTQLAKRMRTETIITFRKPVLV